MPHEIFNLIKEIFGKVIYFSDNPTVAAILVVIIGILMGGWQYRRQKRIDFIEIQKHKFIELLVSLSVEVEYVYLVQKGISDTYQSIGQNPEATKNFLDVIKAYEIPRLSKLINEDIPLIEKNITIYFNSFFQDKKHLEKIYDDYKKQFKDWHDSAGNWITSIGENKEISSIIENKEISSQLNTQKINEIINKLVEEIKNI